MTPTQLRDQVAHEAKTDTLLAGEIAERIGDPWFRSQAWSHLARYADDPLKFSVQAAKSAAEGRDNYQRSAVRAWEIAALAERGYLKQARESLFEAVELALTVEPVSSRSEALLLLLQAAFKIAIDDANAVGEILRRSCSPGHWRVKRALRDTDKMLSGLMQPREFYW